MKKSRFSNQHHQLFMLIQAFHFLLATFIEKKTALQQTHYASDIYTAAQIRDEVR